MATDLSGKTILITGGNAGIGKETAVALARMGADVVIVSRNHARGEAAVAEIRQRSGSQRVSMLQADMASMQSIRALADAFKAGHGRLDVLVNNAGALHYERHETADGLEMTFGVNHIGYFLLTHLLQDLLKATPGARIVNVSSEAHRMGRVNFDDLNSTRSYGAYPAYGTSKLMNLLFTYELARRLEGTGVTVNALHPGVIASGFGSGGNLFWRVGFALVRPFMQSAEGGARTSIFLASSPEVEGVTGKYFIRCKPRRSSAASYDQATARRLWEVSEQICGLAPGTGSAGA